MSIIKTYLCLKFLNFAIWIYEYGKQKDPEFTDEDETNLEWLKWQKTMIEGMRGY